MYLVFSIHPYICMLCRILISVPYIPMSTHTYMHDLLIISIPPAVLAS